MSDRAKINEAQLENVSGGFPPPELEGRDKNCYFEPARPFEWRQSGDKVQARCKSQCQGFLTFCSCHGTARCVDRWHDITESSYGQWTPSPRHGYNHSDPRKQLNGLYPY